MNVYPNAVENALAGVDGVGPEYRIVIERLAELDVFRLEIEALADDVAGTVRDRVKSAVGVGPEVVVHRPDTLETTEFKSRRIDDRRNAAASAAATQA